MELRQKEEHDRSPYLHGGWSKRNLTSDWTRDWSVWGRTGCSPMWCSGRLRAPRDCWRRSAPGRTNIESIALSPPTRYKSTSWHSRTRNAATFRWNVDPPRPTRWWCSRVLSYSCPTPACLSREGLPPPSCVNLLGIITSAHSKKSRDRGKGQMRHNNKLSINRNYPYFAEMANEIEIKCSSIYWIIDIEGKWHV